ncbi:MAG TPA: alpha/beta hydrolase [Solirubrobacteraceae bacterium]|jgi:pimeloyl-ACP methyl ester carboxylesterase|nr:alpha/beta hydrolase [Solirubrobacteraceae bacterium]
MRSRRTRNLTATTLVCAAALLSVPATAAALKVTWMKGLAVPGTPAKYDKVGVIKVGPAKAKNVLVLAPGTSAGSAYFVPLAQWLVSKLPGWQVWSEERRENLLEDQSVLNLAKRGKASAQTVFNYYLGYLTDPSVTRHFKLIPDSSVQFAKQWGMNVAVQDLHRVIAAADKLGGNVVLGGHSLGGSVVTAYATWNFNGHPGADDLDGLVYIDGGSVPAESAAEATAALTTLGQQATPWLSFGGIAAPFAGLFNATGSLGALQDPNARSLGQQFPALPADLKPPVPVTNLGQYGYALNVGTSPASLIAAQGHLGKGVTKSAKNGLHGWDGSGALTPIKRFATMFSGIGTNNVDGTEWYFPLRLTDDTRAVNNGLANPAQAVLDVHSTMGRRLPHRLKIYAFGAALGGQGVLLDAQQLAKQSHIPRRNLVLINRHSTYAHNDPAGAFPHNVFFAHLVPFLRQFPTPGTATG